MTTTEEKLRDFLEEEDFQVYPYEQDGQQNAEVEKWTDGGVDMIFQVSPFTKAKFIERVEEFDVDDEVESHRQDKLYRQNFTITESLKDFKNFRRDLRQTVKRMKKL